MVVGIISSNGITTKRLFGCGQIAKIDCKSPLALSQKKGMKI